MMEYRFPRPIPAASLNRCRIQLAQAPEDLAGKTGAELLSKKAISSLAAGYAVDLDSVFAVRFGIPDGFIAEWSRRLHFFILNLVRGDYFPNHSDADVQIIGRAWSRAKTIVCAGGLFNHHFARRIIDRANLMLDSAGIETRLVPADQPRHRVLTGLIRHLENHAVPWRPALALDFGHGDLKFAWAASPGGFQMEKPIPINFSRTLGGDDRDLASHIYDQMQEKIHEGMKVSGFSTNEALNFAFSLAAYMHEGTLLENPVGAYARLFYLDPDLRSLFFHNFHPESRLDFFHDGQAAALSLSEDQDAILVFGTAIGYGFAPDGRLFS